MLSFLRQLDWILLGAVFGLVFMGLATLYGLEGGGREFSRQFVWLGIGAAIFLFFANLNYKIFRDSSFWTLTVYLIGLVLLLALLIFGQETRGVVSWFYFGGIAAQPVEFVKLAMILLLAKYFSLRHIEIHQARHIIISGLYVLAPAALVLIQPDFGSAAVLLAIWGGMMILAGLKSRHLAVLVAAALALVFAAWRFFFEEYQQNRLLSFLSPTSDPLGSGYQVIQSLIAVGSGGLMGKGLGYGTQSNLGFLPERETDFIFAVIAEEWGFIGSMLVLALFAVIFWRIFATARSTDNNFGRFFAGGFLVFIFTQFAINVGMNLGMLPVTGLSLPFVSYGGSGMAAMFAGLGILQSIRLRSAAYARSGDEDILIIQSPISS